MWSREYILLMPSHKAAVVLGLSWLRVHNPDTAWGCPSIEHRSQFCHANCSQPAVSGCTPVTSTTSEVICLDKIPQEYHDLSKVFSKDCAQ